MDEKDLKRYTVILGGGSGVLFQPLDEDKTYILTAKHNLYKNIGEGRNKSTELLDKINFSYSNNQDTTIKCTIIKGENYFEHKTADAAILIIDKIDGYDQIFIDEKCTAFNECLLCGYPGKTSNNRNDRYTNHQINRKIITTENKYLRLETNFGNLNHEDIVGFSGGGILRLSN